MSAARFVTIHLARFDQMRENGGVCGEAPAGTLFCEAAADTRASGAEPVSQQAFVFLLLGLHADEASARALLSQRRKVTPWMDEAQEIFGAVLEPFRHKDEVNFLNPEVPGGLFDALGPPASPQDPMVAITTVGYRLSDQLDMERVRKFSTGVMAVRTSMTCVDGLGSQQTFSFPGMLAIDPVTVTFWRDDAAIRSFSYGAGVNRLQMDRYRAEDLADRTSFTRCRVVESTGTWYGWNPIASGAFYCKG